MRPRRSSARLALIAGAILSCAATPLAAQDTEGALFLLVPVGARAVSLGQAVVANVGGSESIWWNPAGLARAERREAAIHHSDSFILQGDAVALVIPSALLGVISASVNILNFGEQDLTEAGSGVKVGEVLVRSFVYGGTYATPIGDHINAGITYKLVQFRFDCSGACGDAPATATTSGIDIGAQYDLRRFAPLAVGAVLRNLGPSLQVNDTEQRDQIPTRLHVGVQYRYTGFDGDLRGAAVNVSAEVADAIRFASPSSYFGVDLSWHERVHLRAGYANEASEASGLSMGLGISLGSLVLDVARIFEGFSADAGQAPTYLSLRYLF
ncbi:MAG TPA: PorV/PorQ family protein [Gemmatimonadaceae bacterium]|nr:PorV/PorQ family protein [Gemmatimonadaceae bacterium]